MKKKESNLAVTTTSGCCVTLEERILHSNLSEEDKIAIIKIIGRQEAGRYTGWPSTTVSPLQTTPDIVYCNVCCKE